jgi:hypothetical protein
MLITLMSTVILGLCLVLWGVKPPEGMTRYGGGGGKDPNDRKNLKDHGKGLQEKVSGKKCPHCGKPI